jgi:hypothetical protein
MVIPNYLKGLSSLDEMLSTTIQNCSEGESLSIDYRDEFMISLEGLKDIDFLTPSGRAIASGYERLVLGDRGPCINYRLLCKQKLTLLKHLDGIQDHTSGILKFDKRKVFIRG